MHISGAALSGLAISVASIPKSISVVLRSDWDEQ